MISAYNITDVKSLSRLETAKTLKKEGFIGADQPLIDLEQESVLYHPGWVMRVLLFIVGLVAISGLLGLWVVLFEDLLDQAWEFFLIGSGVLGLVLHEMVLVRGLKHYKSGLTEVSLYNFISLIGMGMAGLLDHYAAAAALAIAVVCAAASLRYRDGLLAAAALLALEAALFNMLFDAGGAAQVFIPFASMGLFGLVYALAQYLDKRDGLMDWQPLIDVMEAISMGLVYLSVNYLVVRELSVSMLNLDIQPGEDIALAAVFYGLTILLPLVFLVHGLFRRNRISLWVGMGCAAASVYTFYMYFWVGYGEITLTVSGAAVLLLAVYALNRLKTPVKGVTRQLLITANLDVMTIEGIVISQTAGGLSSGDQPLFKGGDFGGGGASGQY